MPKTLTPGHKYAALHFENKDAFTEIQFIEKRKTEDGKFVTVNDGTTVEELLTILINRIGFLNSKNPCRENTITLTKLEEALMWQIKRTVDRAKRKVEGTPKP